MPPPVLAPSLLAGSLVMLLAAAPERELVFVGTSMAGGADPFAVVEAVTGKVAASGASPATDNVSATAWDASRGRLYVVASLAGAISCADVTSGAPKWTEVRRGEHPCHGLGLDRARGRLYTLEGPTATSCELVAIELGDDGRGRELARTSELSGRSVERWALAPDGRFAALPTMLVEGGSLRIVDTQEPDPAAGDTYLEATASVPMPPIEGFTACSAIAIAPDGQWVFLAFSGISAHGVLRFHVPTRRWIDFDPAAGGVQALASPGTVPTMLAIAPDGSFLVAAGAGDGGWLARIDLDPWNPAVASRSELLRGSRAFDGASSLALSRDGTRVAIASAKPARLAVVHALRGELLRTIPLPAGSSFTGATWCESGEVR